MPEAGQKIMKYFTNGRNGFYQVNPEGFPDK